MLCIWPSGRLFSLRQNTQKKKRDTLSSTSIVSSRRRRTSFLLCIFYDMWREKETSNGDQTVCDANKLSNKLYPFEKGEMLQSLCVCDDGRVTMSQCALGMGRTNLSTVR